MVIMTKQIACSLLLSLGLPVLAHAESIELHCVYTEATFNAAYMSQPETRDCPQNRCFYDLRFDTDGTVGSVNEVAGYLLKVDGNHFQLERRVRNRVVGGEDLASFSINGQDLSYTSVKSTSPGVSLTTAGQCQIIE